MHPLNNLHFIAKCMKQYLMLWCLTMLMTHICMEFDVALFFRITVIVKC